VILGVVHFAGHHRASGRDDSGRGVSGRDVPQAEVLRGYYQAFVVFAEMKCEVVGIVDASLFVAVVICYPGRSRQSIFAHLSLGWRGHLSNESLQKRMNPLITQW